MVIEKLLTVDDLDAWRSVLPANVNVFGSVEYASIVQQISNNKACLFVVESGESLIAYPFFLRPINTLVFATDRFEGLWDSMTPEFTGPIQRNAVEPAMRCYFLQKFSDFCRNERVITEFAHLHPWNSGAGLLDPAGVEFDREIVYVDLAWPEERLWQDSFTYACRKNIRRSRQEKLRVVEAKTLDDIREFYRIYIGTLDRRQAAQRYYFPFEYFAALFEQMRCQSRFVLAEYGDQIVAATLYLHDDTDVYSYLGGADTDFQAVRPTNAIVYETIQWAQRSGKKRLILGGGYQPEDGIFRFKASFSPLRARFHVYKHVHLLDHYSALSDAWSRYYHRDTTPRGYFPTYRCVLSEDEQEPS